MQLLRTRPCATAVFGIVLMVLAAVALHAASPKPRLVGEINLNALIHESEGLLPSTHSVQALAFSPDEKWIAVGVGFHRKPGPSQPGAGASHLIVAPVKEGSGKSNRVCG